MVETNLRFIGYGERLHLDVRRVRMRASDSSADLPEKACRFLRTRHGLAAVPDLSDPDSPLLFVASRTSLSELALQDEDWLVELRDVGGTRLLFGKPHDAQVMASLFERQLLIQLRRHTQMWTLDSPRIWYEDEPFLVEDRIAAVRRFHVSVVPVEDRGLGVVVHVSTAFFTVDTIADFFDESVSPGEQERQRQRFEQLSMRQHGQKGTLQYNLHRSRHKCYFSEFLSGVTCASTGSIPIRGKIYPSLYEYYNQERAYVGISADDPVARVSFPGLGRPRPVAANRLHLRVMNAALPTKLKQVDKIPPDERAQLIDHFWRTVKADMLGKGLNIGLWQPSVPNVAHLKLPTLLFGQNTELPSPSETTISTYKRHFQSRLSTLDHVGCYYVLPTMEREIMVASPSHLSTQMLSEFTDDLIQRLSKWTGKQLSSRIVHYATIQEAIAELNSHATGVVVFVFEDLRPETYYLLSIELRNWRIKRVTANELTHQFRQMKRRGRGSGRWCSFMDLNALDVLQQLDCVPWTLRTPLNYQAQLAIDVGVDRRYFALSLLICRPQNTQIPFWLDTLLCPKPDHRRETIESVVLRDKIVELCKPLRLRRFDPLDSILWLRDGRMSGDEGEAIREAQAELIQQNILSIHSRTDVVDFHKRSLKEIRLWERNGSVVANTLEGTALFLDHRTAILATTGIATLHQGTSNPLMLVTNDDGADMFAIASDVFATAQLNWSNPRVAQRLPVPIRRTDQILETRRAQETRGLR